MSQSYSNIRIGTLKNNLNIEMRKISDDMGWNIMIDEECDLHSYIVFSVTKENISHKLGYLYSQSTDKSVYRKLESLSEIILIYGKGMSFEENNSFSAGCTIPVIPDSDFLYVMIDWHMDFLGVSSTVNVSKSARHFSSEETIRIIEENPLEQIYTHLRALTSKNVAYKAIERHNNKKHTDISNDIMESKAIGISHLVQNAIDYYSSASTENMTQRMLNLYYGTIALMEAEMLVYGDKYKNLSEIEKITKSGHGLTTFGDATDLKDFFVGAINNGLFRAWLSHRGVNVSDFPVSRKDVEKSDFKSSFYDLLCHIPELQNILQEIDEDYRPYFLFPSFDIHMNHTIGLGSRKSIYKRKFNGTCIALLNLEGKCDYDWEKEVILSFLAPLTIIGKYRNEQTGSEGWKVMVLHGPDKLHWDSYSTHKGLSNTVIISPLFHRTDEWDVYAVMILYTLSIVVRYMPNLWSRIMVGDLDSYKAVFYQFSRIAERELTQIFLEKLTNKHVIISHPQGVI